MPMPVWLSLANIAVILALLVPVLLVEATKRYLAPAKYEDAAKEYGMKRKRWEPIKEWEDRIWRKTERRLDTGRALMTKATQAGLIRYFPPRQRPPMPAGVTWTTGIDFANGLPFVVWLPDDHPTAVAYREAHAPEPDA